MQSFLFDFQSSYLSHLIISGISYRFILPLIADRTYFRNPNGRFYPHRTQLGLMIQTLCPYFANTINVSHPARKSHCGTLRTSEEPIQTLVMPTDQEESLSRSDSWGQTLSRRRTDSRFGEEHVPRPEFSGAGATSTRIYEFLQDFYRFLDPSLSNED